MNGVAPRRLCLRKRDTLMTAQSAEAVWLSLSNDEFFHFQAYFQWATGKRLRGYRQMEEAGTDQLIPKAVDALCAAVDRLNAEVDFDGPPKSSADFLAARKGVAGSALQGQVPGVEAVVGCLYQQLAARVGDTARPLGELNELLFVSARGDS